VYCLVSVTEIYDVFHIFTTLFGRIYFQHLFILVYIHLVFLVATTLIVNVVIVVFVKCLIKTVIFS